MKKIYSAFIVAGVSLVLPLTVSAQQLPSVGFEGDWVDCEPFDNYVSLAVVGTQPSGWFVSNHPGSTGSGQQMRPLEIATMVDGYNSANAIMLTNRTVEGNGAGGVVIPAYMTLGTPWMCGGLPMFGGAKINYFDYGTYGGVKFTHRPDALEFMYKRSLGEHVSNEVATVAAYTWTGTYTNESVCVNVKHGGSTGDQYIDMEDRDRLILYGKESLANCGGESGVMGNTGKKYIWPEWVDCTSATDGAGVVAKVIKTIEGGADEWTKFSAPFEYNAEGAPEKLNIIISANDYFTHQHKDHSNLSGKDNSLTVDDVKLVYWSRLKSLKVGAQDVALEEGRYNYQLPMNYTNNVADYVAESLGQTASKPEVKLDEANRSAVITVKNVGEDSDGQTSHDYNIYFADTAAITDITVDASDAPVEYYNLQGIRVENPAQGGIYIRRQGNDVKKVVVK